MSIFKKICKTTMIGIFMAPLSGLADVGARQYAEFSGSSGLTGMMTHYHFSSRHKGFYQHNGTSVAQFSLSQAFEYGQLHFGNTFSEDERHYHTGLSMGPATVAYFQARANSFSKADNYLYPDLNQYFFHGGKRQSFRLQGFGANFKIGNRLSTQFTMSKITAPQVEDRYGYYAGISTQRFEGGVFQIDKGDEKVGEGLNLSFRGKKFSLGYQQISSETDAHLRRIGFNWKRSSGQLFSIDLEQAKHDLFADGEEQRVMFRFKRSLGRKTLFNATDQGEPDNNQGYGKIIGLGVGVGVAAVAVSSGGDSDSSERFSARNETAFEVMNFINPVSVRENREHGGWIFRNADGSFGFTDPVAGDVSSVNIGNPVTSVPVGTVASASYHTHGGPDPRFDNENFSPTDIAADVLQMVDGYLGTPGDVNGGFLKLHEHRTGNISVLGRINN